MADTPQKQPWERQADEPLRCYRRFLKYRALGPERSVRKACDIAKFPREGRKPSWQYWRKLAEQWHWRDRARAYDEHQEYQLRHAELEAEGKAREEQAAERIQQRDLLRKEAISLRTIARMLAARILEVLQDKDALRQLTLKRRKTVVTSRVIPMAPGLAEAKPGEKADPPMLTEQRIEEVWPGVLELLKLAGDGMEVGGRLYRLAQLDEPDEEGQPKTAERRAEDVAKVLTGRLLALGMDELLLLREGLVSDNGKVP